MALLHLELEVPSDTERIVILQDNDASITVNSQPSLGNSYRFCCDFWDAAIIVRHKFPHLRSILIRYYPAHAHDDEATHPHTVADTVASAMARTDEHGNPGELPKLASPIHCEYGVHAPLEYGILRRFFGRMQMIPFPEKDELTEETERRHFTRSLRPRRGRIPRYTHYKVQEFAWYVISGAALPGCTCACGVTPVTAVHITTCPATMPLWSACRFQPPLEAPLDCGFLRLVLKLGVRQEYRQYIGWHTRRVTDGAVLSRGFQPTQAEAADGGAEDTDADATIRGHADVTV
jgi:hypothetical protein